MEEVFELTEERIKALLPPRPRTSHKGMNGRALLMAGSARFSGAALLSAAAALRAGAGVLYACVPQGIRPEFFALPEAICIGAGDGGTWNEAAMAQAISELSGKDALAIGPGMGGMESGALMKDALKTGLPTVLDADALNHLAKNRDLLSLLHAEVILTPHPGEMARLTGESIDAIVSAPKIQTEKWAKTFGCTVLLKGAESYISDGRRVAVNRTGNPGLAKGGSGDVLTGLILAFLSQGLSPFDAASAGACLLGASADEAYQILGNRMLMARDVIEAIADTIQIQF